MTTTDRPTRPYPRVTAFGTYVHMPPPAEDGDRHHGEVIAYARRRPSDRRWEVRHTATRHTIGSFDTYSQAAKALAQATGIDVADLVVA